MRDDDSRERLAGLLDALAKAAPVGHAERRVDGDHVGRRFDEIGVDWKETCLEAMNHQWCVSHAIHSCRCVP